jgi:hypothetical protein
MPLEETLRQVRLSRIPKCPLPGRVSWSIIGPDTAV